MDRQIYFEKEKIDMQRLIENGADRVDVRRCLDVVPRAGMMPMLELTVEDNRYVLGYGGLPGQSAHALADRINATDPQRAVVTDAYNVKKLGRHGQELSAVEIRHEDPEVRNSVQWRYTREGIDSRGNRRVSFEGMYLLPH